MALKNDHRTVVEADSERPSCVTVYSRLHECSFTEYVQGFGSSDSTNNFAGSGQITRLLGEVDGPLVEEAPTCDCKNQGVRNGAHRVQDEDGRKWLYVEPAPRKWRVESSSFSSAGNGPAGDAGDTALISPMTFAIDAGCYPLQVTAKLAVCDWFLKPAVVEDVAAYAEWSHTIVDPAVEDDDPDDPVLERCDLFYAHGGSIDKDVGVFTVPAQGNLELSADLGLHYSEKVENSFPNRIGSAKWVFDVCEITSLGELDEGC